MYKRALMAQLRGRAAEQIVAQELKPVLDRHYKEEQCYWMREILHPGAAYSRPRKQTI